MESHCRQALGLRQKLVEECPDVPEYREALALSHHYLGSWLADRGLLPEAGQNCLQAVVEQEKVVTEFPNLLNGQTESFNTFFLAMARWQLGDKEYARTWYGRAVRWMEQHQPENEELRRFRAEAAE